jgi:serine/threonine protein kinase
LFVFHLFPFQSAKHIVEGKAEMTEAEKVIMDGHSVLEPLITKRPRYKRYKRTMKHADVEQKLGGDSDISTEHATDIVGGLGGDSILDKISRELQKSRRGEVITHNIMNNNGVKLVANKPTLEPTYTAKADVYSFGMTCYEVLTGCTPFSSLPRSAVYKRVIAGERPELPADIDTRLYNLIQMCWDTDAQKRPTFKEIRSSLEDIMMPPISQLHSQAPRLNGQCTIS